MFRVPLLLLLLPVLSSASCNAFGEDTVLVTLKLAKTAQAAGQTSATLRFPSSCTACKVVDDPAYVRQNTREIIVAMRVPRSTALALHIQTDATAFRRILLETVDLSFERKPDGLHFTLPAQIADRPDSGEFQSHLYFPGVELRFEHADPERRAGDYLKGEFPSIQRAAAANIEFGLLEAIRRLGLDHYVDDENLGRLFLMGFDTNDPHGHLDSPPHMHLALWLPNYHGTGSEIPHLYLTPDGLISHNLAGTYRGGMASPLDYGPGLPFQAMDDLGRPMFSLTITPQGWLTFTRFDGPQCSLNPIAHGFDSGVKVSCPDFPALSLRVEDDLQEGRIRESIDGGPTATFPYDRDSGLLLNP